MDEAGREEEYVMLALRTAAGINLKEYANLFGGDFLKKYSVQIEKVREYIEINGDFLKIKDEYLFVQNQIIVEFLD